MIKYIFIWFFYKITKLLRNIVSWSASLLVPESMHSQTLEWAAPPDPRMNPDIDGIIIVPSAGRNAMSATCVVPVRNWLNTNAKIFHSRSILTFSARLRQSADRSSDSNYKWVVFSSHFTVIRHVKYALSRRDYIAWYCAQAVSWCIICVFSQQMRASSELVYHLYILTADAG